MICTDILRPQFISTNVGSQAQAGLTRSERSWAAMLLDD